MFVVSIWILILFVGVIGCDVWYKMFLIFKCREFTSFKSTFTDVLIGVKLTVILFIFMYFIVVEMLVGIMSSF